MYILYMRIKKQTKSKHIFLTFPAFLIAACLCLSITVGLSSCTNGYKVSERLTKIDSICNTAPDSAKTLLEEYKLNNKPSDSAEIWFIRYLEIKTKVKFNGFFENDSDINAILEHYADCNDKGLMSQIYYCAGCIYVSLQNMPQAMDFFQKALKTIENEKDSEKLEALCCYQIGYVLMNQSLDAEACHWTQRALNLHIDMADSMRCIYDYENLAWSYRRTNKVDSALTCLKRAISIAEKTDDKETVTEIECQIASVYNDLGDTLLAKKHIDQALTYPSALSLSQTYSKALEIYHKLQLNNKTNALCDSVMKYGNVYGKEYAYWWLTQKSIHDNESNKAKTYLEKYKSYTDSVDFINASEAIAKANAAYNYNQKEKENRQLELENARQWIGLAISISLSIVIVMSAFIVVVTVRKRKNDIEKKNILLNSLLKKSQEALTQEINEKEKEITVLNNNMAKFKEENIRKKNEYDSALQLMEQDLLLARKELERNKSGKNYLVKTSVYKHIANICSNESTNNFHEWKELEQAINTAFPDFFEKLYRFKKMSEIEWHVCMLIKLELNFTEIAKIVNKSPNTIYSICKRLHNKNFGFSAKPNEWAEIIRGLKDS